MHIHVTVLNAHCYCQASKNPRKGIETLTVIGTLEHLTSHVRHQKIPARGLKHRLQQPFWMAQVQCQASKNPRKGIET